MNFEDIKGFIFSKIEKSAYDDELIFHTYGKDKYRQYHDQECCETVELIDICGDLDDLVDTPILYANEVSSKSENDYNDTHKTWTFYTISTIKGIVTIRWKGESSGYYSESVNFEKVKPDSNYD